MTDNIATVYFTDESEYISCGGTLLKYREQANMVKYSMVSDEKIIADSFKDSEAKPFGTLLNFFLSANWNEYYDEFRSLLEEFNWDKLKKRKVKIQKGIDELSGTEPAQAIYTQAAYKIAFMYDKLCRNFSDEIAELFIQCTIPGYFASLYEHAQISDFLALIGLSENNKKYGEPKEITLAMKLCNAIVYCDYDNGILEDNELCNCYDTGLIAVMYYIISRLAADLREWGKFAEDIKKSVSKIIETDKKIGSKNISQDMLTINRFIPKIDYDGIVQISEEYFEAYSKSSTKIPMEEKLKYKQIQKIKAVRFRSLYSAVCYELNHIYFIGRHLSKCEACGKYFASKTTRARYCSDCVKAEEYAKQYVNIDEYKKLYLKNNKAYNARYNRDTTIEPEYKKWQENAKKLLAEAQNGGYTIDEFAKLIALPVSEKKPGQPRKQK